jgi:uncharacterized protein (DUF488 family)
MGPRRSRTVERVGRIPDGGRTTYGGGVTEPRLYSVGHGDRELGELVSILRAAEVRRVVDVRVAPGSKRHPHFAKEPLARSLESAGIEYVWRGTELGGFRRPRPDSRHTALRNEAFRGYADHMETEAFRAGLDWMLGTASSVPTAFLCAESDWRRCHRRFLSDAVLARGGRVIHLLGGREEEHVLHPDARVEGTGLVYDGAQATML